MTVVNELEGLQRGGVKPGEVVDAASLAHAERVALSAKEALVFLRQRPPNLRCVTTRGSTLNSTVFTSEDDGQQVSIAEVSLPRRLSGVKGHSLINVCSLVCCRIR